MGSLASYTLPASALMWGWNMGAVRCCRCNGTHGFSQRPATDFHNCQRKILSWHLGC